MGIGNYSMVNKMNEKIVKKLAELITELGKPKTYEVGFVQGNDVIKEGLGILGIGASDVLGFSKSENETRIRKVRGAHAWFTKMYKEGWRFKGLFEQEGLLHNGFVIVEKEVPNQSINLIIEELNSLLYEPTTSLEEKKQLTIETVNLDKPINTEIEQEEFVDEVLQPTNGFEISEVNDFIIESKTQMRSLEEIFFDETGQRAVWHGKETKAFKEWKAKLDG